MLIPHVNSAQTIALAALLLLYTATAVAQSAHERDDFQSWNEVQLQVPLQRYMELRLLGATRIGRTSSHFVNERYGASVGFRLGKYLVVSPAVYSIASQPLAYQHDREIRLTIEGTVTVPWKGFIWSVRPRYERRFMESGDSSRQRDKIQAERHIRLHGVELKTFLWDEIQFDWAKKAWSRNRFAIGGGKELGGRTSLEIYYLRQNDGYSHPGNIHAIGTMLRVSLGKH